MTKDFSWIESFYTHFLGRDFCYITSGGLLICIIEYSWWGEIFFPKGLSIELIIFLTVSYFFGLSISSLSSKFKFTKKKEVSIQGYKYGLIFINDLINNFDARVINRYERLIYLMNLENTIGVSSLLSAIIMAVIALSRFFSESESPTVEYLLLAFFLFIYAIFMINSSKESGRTVDEAEKGFVNAIESKQKKKI